MTKFFNKFTKTLFLAQFWSIFQFLGAKIFFLQKIWLSCTTSYLAPCQNLEKTNNTIPRKRQDGRNDEQTLFHRTPPATARGPKILLNSKKVGPSLIRMIQRISNTKEKHKQNSLLRLCIEKNKNINNKTRKNDFISYENSCINCYFFNIF